MPLRDHFDESLKRRWRWEPLHAGWPMKIAERLLPFVKPRFAAVPQTHVGVSIEADVATYEDAAFLGKPMPAGGMATAWRPEAPTLTAELDELDLDEFAVHVFDTEDEDRLVATVELISPANKDRPDHREKFVAKCVALVQQGVSVALVDVVTTRGGNLYAEMLRALGQEDPALGHASLYAAELRRLEPPIGRPRLEAWVRELTVGAALPTLPLWLAENLAVPLELEASYEDALEVMQMPSLTPR